MCLGLDASNRPKGGDIFRKIRFKIGFLMHNPWLDWKNNRIYTQPQEETLLSYVVKKQTPIKTFEEVNYNNPWAKGGNHRA